MGALFGLILLLATSCWAQGVSPAILPPLVRLNVAVVDGHGKPVTDLTAEDLKISDQGKSQKIAFFRRPGAARVAPAGAGEAVSRTSAEMPHTSAILFDLMNGLQSNRQEAGRRLSKALAQMPSGEGLYMYVLTLEGKLYPIEPMQDEKGNVRSAPKDWTKEAEGRIDKALKSLGRARPAGILQEEVVKRTYVALETVANQLAAYPGHRDILWVTDSMPYVTDSRVTCSGDWIECALYVPHLSTTLDKAGVALNPMSFGSALGPTTTLVMEEGAGLTGGRAFFGEELTTVLEQVRGEAGGSYFVAYVPDKESWDNKFHRIKLECARKGVKAAARNRYYALPDVSQIPALEQAAIGSLARLPGDAPEIGLRARAVPAAGNAKAVRLQLRIDAADLLNLDFGDHVEAQVSVAFVHYGPDGVLGAPMPATFNLRLTKPQLEAGLKEGLPFDQDHLVEPNAKRIRFILFDRGSKAIGSVTFPLPGR